MKCLNCNKEIENIKNKRRKYCSTKCQLKFWRENNQYKIKVYRKTRLKVRKNLNCLNCNNVLTGKKLLYCCHSCASQGWNNFNKEKLLFFQNEWKKNNLLKIREREKEYLKENPDKYIRKLIRNKDRRQQREELIKIYGSCLKCGSLDNLELHHKDYSVNRTIIILCRNCHRQLHKEQKLQEVSLEWAKNR